MCRRPLTCGGRWLQRKRPPEEELEQLRVEAAAAVAGFTEGSAAVWGYNAVEEAVLAMLMAGLPDGATEVSAAPQLPSAAELCMIVGR